MFTLIDAGSETRMPATIADGRVAVPREAVGEALGWELTPDGLCGHGMCIPVRGDAALVRGDGIDLAALAATLDRPLAIDVDERVAYLGVSAGERARALRSLIAPDFTLPDLAGRLHSLAEHRGKKVLLVAYASW